MQFLRHFLLAVQFFTRIPITGKLADWVGFSPAMLRASAAHFPAVGLLVGAAAAACYALLAQLLPDSTHTPLVAAALSTALTVMLTGAFHEDGLADVADGLGGSYDKARALEIMKDSRVGAFGALALVLALLVKVALLALLGSVEGAPEGWDEAPFQTWFVCSALLAGHVVSRTLSLLLVYWLPHVGDSAASKSKPLADQISPGSLLVAFLWCFVALALVLWAQAAINLIVACSAAAIVLLYMYRMFKRRLQGFTGDCLGATQQVCEIAFYLGLAISL
jgi:adenosylcobinamide-GDP ribazoletransferase